MNKLIIIDSYRSLFYYQLQSISVFISALLIFSPQFNCLKLFFHLFWPDPPQKGWRASNYRYKKKRNTKKIIASCLFSPCYIPCFSMGTGAVFYHTDLLYLPEVSGKTLKTAYNNR